MRYWILISFFFSCNSEFFLQSDAAPIPITSALVATLWPDFGNTPGWQVPVSLAEGDRIIAYGALEFDNWDRELILRIIEPGDESGVGVLHGPITLTALAGFADVFISFAPITMGNRPILIQVFRPNIRIVNRGRLRGVWIETLEHGKVHYSAISGNGAGEPVGYLDPSIDWYEP